MSGLLQFFVLIFITYWVCALAGVIVVRSGTSIGRKLEVYTWNSRIEMWHRLPQFRLLFNAMEGGQVVATSLLVMVFNLPMVVLQCFVGLVLVSPLLAAGTGAFAGLIIGQGKGRRFFIYAAATAVFEFGAFATAGSIGMSIGHAWLVQGVAFADATGLVLRSAGAYSLVPLACLVGNGLMEAAGPCLFRIDGVPGMRAYRNRTLKQEIQPGVDGGMCGH